MIKKCFVAVTAALLLAVVPMSAASADPAFGPGNGTQGGNQKCHPPGQTVEEPGCK